MPSYAIRILSPQAALACAAILALTACERGAGTTEPAVEFAWARAALARNPQIELVASDARSGVFTVRDRNTNEMLAVKLDELAAAPVSQLKTAAAAPSTTPPRSSQTAAAPANEPAQAPSSAAQSPSTEPASVARATDQEPATPPSAEEPADGKNYTIERSDGRIRVSGPGISIVSSGTATPGNVQNEPGQRAVEPIICEGHRMIHLDNRSIYVDGDAITARGGCELFITNSRIMASGTGIVVQDAAVHISNSHIAGADSSIDAADRARLYVRGSTFEGIPKRTELALVQDQGGNQWR